MLGVPFCRNFADQQHPGGLVRHAEKGIKIFCQGAPHKMRRVASLYVLQPRCTGKALVWDFCLPCSKEAQNEQWNSKRPDIDVCFPENTYNSHISMQHCLTINLFDLVVRLPRFSLFFFFFFAAYIPTFLTQRFLWRVVMWVPFD